MVKSITHSLKLIFVALTLLVIAGMLFFATGAKEVTWLKPMIERAIVRENSPYRIAIGKAVVDWRTRDRIGALTLEQVELRGLDGQILAKLPEIEVTLYLPSLLMGRVAINQITIINPSLFMVRQESGELRFGLEENRPVLALGQIASSWMNDGSGTRAGNTPETLPFRRLAVEDARLKITDIATGKSLISTPFSARLGRDSQAIYLALLMPFALEGGGIHPKSRAIEASGEMRRDSGEAQVKLQLHQVPMEVFCMVAECGKITQARGDVTGNVTLDFHQGFAFAGANFDLSTKAAVITAPEFFPEPLTLEKGQVVAQVGEGFTRLTVETATLMFADTSITAKIDARKEEAGWSLTLEAEAQDLAMNRLYRYWPLPLAPESRSWVISAITAGTARQATLKATLTPEDFAAPVFPDQFLRAEIEAENLSVRYLPKFPQVQNVSGTVVFTGHTMTADLTSGRLLAGTEIGTSRVFIPDMNAASVPTEASLTFTTTAADVARILALEPFIFDNGFGLNPDTIQGQMAGSLALKFNAFSDTGDESIHLDKLHYALDATLSNVAQQNLARGLTVSNLNGTLALSPEALRFEGAARLEDTNLNLQVERQGDQPLRARVGGVLAHKQFTSVGLPAIPQVMGGSAGITAELEMHKGDFSVRSADIDLTRLVLDVPQITWKKPGGVPGRLQVSHLPRHRFAPHAYRFNIRADDLRAEGEIAAPNEKVIFISVPRLETNLNDFGFLFEDAGANQIVRITGNRLDISESYAKSDNSLLADFPPLHLDVDMRELVLTRTDSFTKLQGTLRCDKLRCNAANFTGNAGGSDFRARIHQVKGQRRFDLYAGNAGDFLRALNITDRMFGGLISLGGTFDDTQTPPQFNGRLLIDNFVIRNSQILSRMLSVGSLQGMNNLLTGSGIPFDRLGADIRAQRGKITVQNGKANGSSLGITMEGGIDTTTTVLSIRGVLVPAYWLNSFVGRIPIIGTIAGGAGEGIVAFRYAVTGKYSNPEVSVNPLSGFTPGFLRNIFGAFEEPLPPELRDMPQ